MNVHPDPSTVAMARTLVDASQDEAERIKLNTAKIAAQVTMWKCVAALVAWTALCAAIPIAIYFVRLGQSLWDGNILP